MDIKTLLENEFQLADDIIYLNHAAVSPWPKRTSDAVKRFADENQTYGAKHYLSWMKTEDQLRKQFARLINSPSADDIAILKNTSEALSTVAYGLTWHNGDNIVISNQEFPSNRIVWESLRKFGVEVRAVDISNTDDPEQNLISACDSNTKLLSISSVQYATGIRMRLHKLGDFCQAQQIYFCVDAIQSIGAFEFDVQAIKADFVMADTHKWMMGPEGVALFYCRSELRNSLELNEYGWHMLNNMADYTSQTWEVADTARRFECGSPNMLGIHAATQSLQLLLDIEINNISLMILERSRRIIEQILQNPNFSLLSPSDPQRQSGIVTFSSHKIASQDLYQKLMNNNVICACRGGGVRFSPHCYTPMNLIDKAISMTAQFDE